jgi:hypothetical protein
MWFLALLALACSGAVVQFKDKDTNTHPFRTSYVQFLTAANVMFWVVCMVGEYQSTLWHDLLPNKRKNLRV